MQIKIQERVITVCSVLLVGGVILSLIAYCAKTATNSGNPTCAELGGKMVLVGYSQVYGGGLAYYPKYKCKIKLEK